jgi:hypothetical protein
MNSINIETESFSSIDSPSSAIRKREIIDYGKLIRICPNDSEKPSDLIEFEIFPKIFYYNKMEEIIFNRWMEQIGSERGEYMAITVQPT